MTDTTKPEKEKTTKTDDRAKPQVKSDKTAAQPDRATGKPKQPTDTVRGATDLKPKETRPTQPKPVEKPKPVHPLPTEYTDKVRAAQKKTDETRRQREDVLARTAVTAAKTQETQKRGQAVRRDRDETVRKGKEAQDRTDIMKKQSIVRQAREITSLNELRGVLNSVESLAATFEKHPENKAIALSLMRYAANIPMDESVRSAEMGARSADMRALYTQATDSSIDDKNPAATDTAYAAAREQRRQDDINLRTQAANLAREGKWDELKKMGPDYVNNYVPNDAITTPAAAVQAVDAGFDINAIHVNSDGSRSTYLQWVNREHECDAQIVRTGVDDLSDPNKPDARTDGVIPAFDRMTTRFGTAGAMVRASEEKGVPIEDETHKDYCKNAELYATMYLGVKRLSTSGQLPQEEQVKVDKSLKVANDAFSAYYVTDFSEATANRLIDSGVKFKPEPKTPEKRNLPETILKNSAGSPAVNEGTEEPAPTRKPTLTYL